MGSVANAALEAVVGLGLLGAMFGAVITIPAVAAFSSKTKKPPTKPTSKDCFNSHCLNGSHLASSFNSPLAIDRHWPADLRAQNQFGLEDTPNRRQLEQTFGYSCRITKTLGVNRA